MAGCNPVAEYWIPLAFQDSALLHSLIGCADAYISGYRSINEGLRGLKHLQAAISIVNERIRAGKDIMSSGTLTVIAGIAMLEVRRRIFNPLFSLVLFLKLLLIDTRTVRAAIITGRFTCKV